MKNCNCDSRPARARAPSAPENVLGRAASRQKIEDARVREHHHEMSGDDFVVDPRIEQGVKSPTPTAAGASSSNVVTSSLRPTCRDIRQRSRAERAREADRRATFRTQAERRAYTSSDERPTLRGRVDSQPPMDSLRKDGIARRSMGHAQSWRSVGTPFAVTKAANANAAAIAKARTTYHLASTAPARFTIRSLSA